MATGYLSRYGVEGDPRFLHKVVTLERRLAERFGPRHVLAVSGGTGAIMCALVALGVGPGVEMLVPGYTCVVDISARGEAEAERDRLAGLLARGATPG
jgi:8-amino-3,8-dideoxy-alpha-D-manno-octulosonate transaminase